MQTLLKTKGTGKVVFYCPLGFFGNDFPYKVRRAPAISDKCPSPHFFIHFLLFIDICCLIQQKYLPFLHLRQNILQNVKNRYTDLRSCNHYTQYSHKILFTFSIFIGFAK